MGGRGPIRDPCSIRGMKENAGGRGIPKPRPIRPKCPKYLSSDARREWRRIVPELERMNLLSCVDGGALEAYCSTYGNMVEAQKVINVFGFTFTTEKGFVARRPEVAVVEKAVQILRSFCAEFGLTPQARARMAMPAEDLEDDPMERFLRGDAI